MNYDFWVIFLKASFNMIATISEKEDNPSAAFCPAGLPYKKDGSAPCTFQGLKFVDWYRLGCYNIK